MDHQYLHDESNNNKIIVFESEIHHQKSYKCAFSYSLDIVNIGYSNPTNDYRPRSEGDNVLGSVRPSVRPSVRLSVSARLCRVRQRAKKSHYQSEEFVCVPNSRADAVDRLLILGVLVSGIMGQKSSLPLVINSHQSLRY